MEHSPQIIRETYGYFYSVCLLMIYRWNDRPLRICGQPPRQTEWSLPAHSPAAESAPRQSAFELPELFFRCKHESLASLANTRSPEAPAAADIHLHASPRPASASVCTAGTTDEKNVPKNIKTLTCTHLSPLVSLCNNQITLALPNELPLPPARGIRSCISEDGGKLLYPTL